MGRAGLTHLSVLSVVAIVVVVVVVVLSEGCCQERRRSSSGVNPPPGGHYRVVRGDPFVMPCVDPGSPPGSTRPLSSGRVVWSRSRSRSRVEAEDPTALPSISPPGREEEEEEESVVSTGNLLEIPALTEELSGRYWCRTASGQGSDFHLEVLEESRWGCSEPGPTKLTLTEDTAGEIDCLPSSCGDPEPPDTRVTWYKGGRAISDLQQQRDVCAEGRRLLLCKVDRTDSSVFSSPDTRNGPMVLVPHGNSTKEVVVGEPHTLLCTAKFGFQRTFDPVVRWYSSGDQGHQMVLIGQQKEQKRERLTRYETLVTQAAVLPALTELQLHHVFTCRAANGVGNASATTRLQRRDAAGRRLAVTVGPLVCVVLLAGLLVTVLRLHTLELTLIYRSYWQKDRKDIDVFLSHGRSCMLEDATGSQTHALLSSRPGPPRGGSPLANTPLEVLLRRLFESSGYRLFLMERDLLPGGVYTEDVVGVLRRSRCLICLLSGHFLSDRSAVFVLEAGVQALLQDPHLRVLVIWTEPRPKSMCGLDPPLPRLVHRALRVLPGLDWLPGLPPDSTRTFWKSFWKVMPKQSSVQLIQRDP
ncbi:hypothetical protein NHX12_005468 [Muraenolepis orangiensis]|uniref:Uncharacterized protein n=1 Tax=Muraenolepis orangiensis TaxID=630683 RepID=A0A9Q0DSZ5_9TELE|nr:hypothetical protein NHX12_005468 [Muraenolepis orangiensis]